MQVLLRLQRVRERAAARIGGTSHDTRSGSKNKRHPAASHRGAIQGAKSALAAR